MQFFIEIILIQMRLQNVLKNSYSYFLVMLGNIEGRMILITNNARRGSKFQNFKAGNFINFD